MEDNSFDNKSFYLVDMGLNKIQHNSIFVEFVIEVAGLALLIVECICIK